MECGSGLPLEAKFCPECGTRVPVLPSEPVSEPQVAEDLLSVPPVPPELLAKFESARKELRGERREVVVLFADLSGFTALSERLDAEEVSFLMQGLLAELADVVYKYEGYVDKYIGDAIMALFGAPLSHEDDAERAVLAALDMLEVTRRQSERGSHNLALRVGLNLGYVVAAHVGSESRIQYTVMGDTVNVASRLESAAALNSVLVSRSVYDRIGSRFEAEEVPPLTVKGKSEPLQAYRVTRFLPSTSRRTATRTPFVGRKEELRAVTSFLARVAGGSPGTLLVEAEAGAGKSRLVQEALSRNELPLTTFRVEFSEIHLPGKLSIAESVFRQLLASSMAEPGEPESSMQQALQMLEGDAEEHLSGIRGLAFETSEKSGRGSSDDLDPRLARQNRWLALTALLATVSRKCPIVILLEDVHWTDEAESEFLAFLLPVISALPIGTIHTARPGSTLPWLPDGTERLGLSSLDERAIRSILGDLFDNLRPTVQADLVRRSEGNPLYLEELSRSLKESLETSAAAVPGTLNGLLQSRIDRLQPAPRFLLQMGSVLGTRFAEGLLARMYQLEAQPVRFNIAFEALQEQGFLEEAGDEDHYGFRHALMQEVAYSGILLRVRKVLHESAARLGEDFFADRVEAEAPFFAHHYWEAGLLLEAAPHLWRAGLAAHLSYDLYAAERFLQRLMEVVDAQPQALEDVDALAGLLSTYGGVLFDRGKFEKADHLFRKLEKLGERESRADWIAKALMNEGQIALFRGETDTAESLYMSGLSHGPLEDEGITATLHSGLGLAYYFRGEAERALKEHAQALHSRERLNDRLAMSTSLMNIGNVMMDLHDNLAGAEEHYRRALALADKDQRLQTALLMNIASVDLEYGNFPSALEKYGRVKEIAEKGGGSFMRWLVLRNEAYCYLCQSDIRPALRALMLTLRDGDQVLDPLNRVATRLLLSEAHLSAHDAKNAARWLHEASHLAEELDMRDHDDWLNIVKGRWAAAQSDWASATLEFEQAVEAATRLHHPYQKKLAQAHLCRAAARAGLEPPEETPKQTGERKPLIALMLYLGADADAANGALQKAAAVLEHAGDLASKIGSLSLERAAFERQAQVLGELGDEVGQRTASLRALRSMRAFERRLPDDLREAFVTHPRNATLGKLTAHSSVSTSTPQSQIRVTSAESRARG